VAVQYAGEVFGQDNVATRYTLLLGAGDVREEVAVASRNSLYSAMKKANKEDFAPRARKESTPEGPLLPDFVEILMYVMDKSAIRLKSSYKVIMGSTELPFTVAVGSEACDYLRLCLWNSAGVSPSKELLSSPETDAPKVVRYLKDLGPPELKRWSAAKGATIEVC